MTRKALTALAVSAAKRKASCGVYWYKFMWNGEVIRESTRQQNRQVAQNPGKRHTAPVSPTVKWEFERRRRYLPWRSFWSATSFLLRRNQSTLRSPAQSNTTETARRCFATQIFGSLPLDEVNDQHAQRFAAQKAKLSASRINCGLRTLRRALNLAYQWGTLEKPAKITLAKGERQRDRVLTDDEITSYLAVCPQPVERRSDDHSRLPGMRPSEVPRFGGSGCYSMPLDRCCRSQRARAKQHDAFCHCFQPSIPFCWHAGQDRGSRKRVGCSHQALVRGI